MCLHWSGLVTWPVYDLFDVEHNWICSAPYTYMTCSARLYLALLLLSSTHSHKTPVWWDLSRQLGTTVLNAWCTLVHHLWLVVCQLLITHESTLNPVFHMYNYMYLCIHTPAATQAYSIYYTFSSSSLVSTGELEFLASVVAVAECATAAGMKQLYTFTYDICVHSTLSFSICAFFFSKSLSYFLFLRWQQRTQPCVQEPDWVPTTYVLWGARLRMWGW